MCQLVTGLYQCHLDNVYTVDNYVTRKDESYNDCTECNDLFENKESTIDLDIEIKYLEYIDYLDRGVYFLQIYHLKT